MDLFGRLIAGLFILWAIAILIGLVISLMPVILFAVGLFLMMAMLTLLGRLLGSWIGY